MTRANPTHVIWTHLSSDLRRFIRRRVSDDHTAEDLLQETFVRIHRSIASLQDADRVAPWVYRIARNVVYDHHRKVSNTASALIETDVADDTEDAGSQVRCGIGDWLEEMIESLPPTYREAVRLSGTEGLSQQEVAEHLGLSLSGAKSRIQRGRAVLKETLERCCHFEFDRRGGMVNCDPKSTRQECQGCGESQAFWEAVVCPQAGTDRPRLACNRFGRTQMCGISSNQSSPIRSFSGVTRHNAH
jgi:RNA polymerase sigma-70 factor (ECF subfamily)